MPFYTSRDDGRSFAFQVTDTPHIPERLRTMEVAGMLFARQRPAAVYVVVNDQYVTARPGDWVVQSALGELSVLSSSTFHSLFKELPNESDQT